MVLENVIQLLQNFGFFRVILPFLLVFALFYAVLLKTKILGDPEANPWVKNIAAIISMVAAFLVIIYTPVVEALMVLIPQASFLLVIIMLLLMMVAFIVPSWGQAVEKPKWWLWIPVGILVLIFVAIAGFSVGPEIPWLYGISQFLMGTFDIGPEAVNLLIGFAIVLGIPLIVIAMIVMGGKKEGISKIKFE